MTVSSSSATLRRTVNMVTAHRAMVILANVMDLEQAKRSERTITELSRISSRTLRAFYVQAKENFHHDERKLGAKCSPERYTLALRQIALDLQGSAGATVAWVTKEFVETLFERYPSLTCFRLLPRHARIAVYPAGRPTGTVEWYLLEAALFEDMAYLWNLTNEHATEPKGSATLARATSRAVFSFLEGFLNGLAFQLWKSDADCSDDDIQALFELDLGRRRPKYVGLREKLLRYPKVAIRAQHPPLSETNCPEMAMVLRFEDEFRNWLVHPSPRPNLPDGQRRDAVFFELTRVKLAELIDAAIGLVQRIAKTVEPLCAHTTLWLYPRDKNGRFNDNVLK